MSNSNRRATILSAAIGLAPRSALAAASALAMCMSATAQESPSYSAAQAATGKTIYERQCVACHGEGLDDGEFGPMLRGDEFLLRWAGKSVEDLFHYVQDTMPTAQPGSLSEEEYLNVIAYLLSKNTIPAGTPVSIAAQKTMTLPSTTANLGMISAGVKLPPNPTAKPSPLAKITPVTEQMLSSPPAGSWLDGRRTRDAQGFSPLKQINKGNVSKLRLSWSLSLPPGPNQNTPLVHDGVMFVHAFKDVLQAVDAVTGDILWQYTYRLPKDVTPTPKKSIAIYDSLVFMPTSDAHIVALNMKTGAVVWNTGVGGSTFTMSGGPIVAKGKVIFGTRGPKPVIVALDAKTGKEAWRFNPIPKPGEPNYDTWNNMPYEARTGGTIWTPGSYDKETNLVFFGPAPTYDTKPLRDRVPGANNDALYTNTTIALNPDTGKLVWHYQHLENDQMDLDWAYERQIMTIGTGAKARRVLVTAGKAALHDALDPATGKYLFSIDLGMQNYITHVDPKTGHKTVDPDLIPGDGKTKMICPSAAGSKNFNPSGFNPTTGVLFVPLIEACMDLVPLPEGQRGLLSTGVRTNNRPMPNSDGLYGRLVAVDLQTKKQLWVTRERVPILTSTLPTAGGLIFAGSMDRTFAAYDQATGKRVWSTRLGDVPNSNPISYEVNGKQYIAVVTGSGAVRSTAYVNMLPEIKNPTMRTSNIWVFELP
ncbi:MAG TPA: PQQ-binding-like beta-propeller repeat protein [Hyphomonadaceae bacterium]|nr:PQQ-binding-like beta-propeller repeat protein [Hyphomonadaceae bacterium]